MAATAAQIAKLRRMVAEPTAGTYTDDDLAGYIELYPTIDEHGEEPYVWTATALAPERDDNDYWVPTYDLNAAAADVWDEKAAALAADYDFSADGSSYNLSQAYLQAMKQVRHYRARRSMRTITLRPEPMRRPASWIGSVGD